MAALMEVEPCETITNPSGSDPQVQVFTRVLKALDLKSINKRYATEKETIVYQMSITVTSCRFLETNIAAEAEEPFEELDKPTP